MANKTISVTTKASPLVALVLLSLLVMLTTMLTHPSLFLPATPMIDLAINLALVNNMMPVCHKFVTNTVFAKTISQKNGLNAKCTTPSLGLKRQRILMSCTYPQNLQNPPSATCCSTCCQATTMILTHLIMLMIVVASQIAAAFAAILTAATITMMIDVVIDPLVLILITITSLMTVHQAARLKTQHLILMVLTKWNGIPTKPQIRTILFILMAMANVKTLSLQLISFPLLWMMTWTSHLTQGETTPLPFDVCNYSYPETKEYNY